MATAPLTEDAIEDADAADTDALREVHKRAMQRFDSVAMPQQTLRELSRRARDFVTRPGAMWEDWGDWPENTPKPEVDKITKSLEKIETDYRENRLMVTFLPDDQQDARTAEMIDGVYRADSIACNAQQARDNAFQEGIRGGFGAWRLGTEWVDEYDRDNDSQRVNPGLAIVDADQKVYFDPASVLYDASDADWAFEISADPRATAEDKWGADNLVDFETYQSLDSRPLWGWYAVDIVYTADYYEVEDAADTLLIFRQGQSGEEQRYFASELPDGLAKDLAAQGWAKTTRKMKRRRIRRYVVNGSKVVKDCGYIAGDRIPIVPFYGRRDWIDNMPWWRGHVQKRMDDQRNLNSQIGRLIEISSLSPIRTPVMFQDEMTPGQAADWAARNKDRKAFLTRLRTFDSAGNPVQSPIEYLEPPSIPEATATVLQFTLSSLTDSDDNADQVKANTSADAMDIAAARVDAKSAIYLDNMRQSLACEGSIYFGMAREVYYEDGRKLETQTLDGQRGQATLGEMQIGADGAYRIRNDLTRGRYRVIADVEESTATKRQKAMRQGLELSQAFMAAQSPQDSLAALYTAAENMDGEGISDLVSFYRQRSIALGATKPTPEEAKQLEAAAEGKQQQPDPAAIALMADAQAKGAKAQLDQAKVGESQAKAALLNAQAETLEKAPTVPTGLDAAPSPVEQVDQLAGARLKIAQANKLDSDVHHQRIKTGAQITQEAHDRMMAERVQDHAESQPKTAPGA